MSDDSREHETTDWRSSTWRGFTLQEINPSALMAGLASPNWTSLEKQLAAELLKRLDAEAGPKGEATPHVPLLMIDRRAIKGLKRCQNCGLSETYWQRWPDCPASTKRESGSAK